MVLPLPTSPTSLVDALATVDGVDERLEDLAAAATGKEQPRIGRDLERRLRKTKELVVHGLVLAGKALNLAVEGRPVDPKQPRRLAQVAFAELERRVDITLLP